MTAAAAAAAARQMRAQPGPNKLGGEIFDITEKRFQPALIPGHPPVMTFIKTTREALK